MSEPPRVAVHVVDPEVVTEPEAARTVLVQTSVVLAYEQARLQAEAKLIAWAEAYRERDEVIRDAVAAGVSRRQVTKLTGIARTTIDRILSSEADRPAPHC